MKWNVVTVMKCESVYLGMQAHIYKAFLNRLNSDKFDTSSSNIYCLISLKMSMLLKIARRSEIKACFVWFKLAVQL